MTRPLVVCSSKTIRSTSNYFWFNVLLKYSFLIHFFCGVMWEQIIIFMSFNKSLDSPKNQINHHDWQLSSVHVHFYMCLSDSSRALLTHYAVHTVHASTSTNDPLTWWIFFDCTHLEAGKKETKPWLCSLHSGVRMFTCRVYNCKAKW